MKRVIMNILTTTGIVLVILAIIALCYGGTVVCISTIFQALFLNILIYIGFVFIDKKECSYSIIETGIKLLYVIILALFFGNIFGWYSSIPIGILLIMTIIVFFVCILLDVIHVKNEVKYINEIIKEKNTIDKI